MGATVARLGMLEMSSGQQGDMCLSCGEGVRLLR